MRPLKLATKISELTFLIGGAWVVYMTSTMKYTGNNPIAPGDYPRALAIVIIIMSILLIVSSKTEKKDRGEKAYKPLLITIIATVIYVFILNIIGFIPSTILLLFGLSMYFSGNKWKISLPYSVGFTLFLYLFFRQFLGVLLPKTPFF